ncbi:PD-(D/E)XK motif protein [Lacticaseibacillus paracasei]|uniref:PD-(D/E)XK motif protein n=1 Tax=Lacticaseibacillus paracasei TaxID=1597 RepID=UPI000F0B835C|nr:PD-(D/E)XK motif protein [Lacticaseibacillus paracasei]RNE16610.1 hypothetical protein FAM3257_03140 [Lacticaseibacillus paracasei]TLQ33659.1 PD-(D/E)XK motif protein [Lacticaseibacillus paracasei]
MEPNHFTRLPNTVIFGIYEGVDDFGRKSFLVKLSKDPQFKFKTKYLVYAIRQRSIDDQWAMTVSIDDNRYTGVFQALINDLADVTRQVSDQQAAERLFLQRFNTWRTLFVNKIEDQMGFLAIIGLAGELLFLKEKIIPEYGADTAIISWNGPDGGDKDFVTANEWFEIKTKSFSKPTVHINNTIQLAPEGPGRLVVIPYSKSTAADPETYTLMGLYEDISGMIDNEDMRTAFERKLANVGFVPDDKYRDPSFRFHPFEQYRVDAGFPHVKFDPRESAISRIEYDLYLPDLQRFRIEG